MYDQDQSGSVPDSTGDPTEEFTPIDLTEFFGGPVQPKTYADPREGKTFDEQVQDAFQQTRDLAQLSRSSKLWQGLQDYAEEIDTLGYGMESALEGVIAAATQFYGEALPAWHATAAAAVVEAHNNYIAAVANLRKSINSEYGI